LKSGPPVCWAGASNLFLLTTALHLRPQAVTLQGLGPPETSASDTTHAATLRGPNSSGVSGPGRRPSGQAPGWLQNRPPVLETGTPSFLSSGQAAAITPENLKPHERFQPPKSHCVPSASPTSQPCSGMQGAPSCLPVSFRPPRIYTSDQEFISGKTTDPTAKSGMPEARMPSATPVGRVDGDPQADRAPRP
jgi:hypothetical protein